MRVHLISAVVAITASIALPSNAFAAPRGPSKAQIRQDLRGAKVIKVVIKHKGSTVSLSGGTWWWEQTVEVTKRTEWRGIKRVVRGDVVYQRRGGRWFYQKMRFNSAWLLGVKPPSKREIQVAFKTVNPKQILGKMYKYAVAVHSLKLPPKPKFTWGQDPNAVDFKATLVYSHKSDDDDVRKVSEDVTFTLKRSKMKAPWTDLCQTKKGCLSGGAWGQMTKEISRTRGAAARAMKKIIVVQREKWIAEKVAPLHLPSKYKDLHQFAEYAWAAMYTGDSDTWQAFLEHSVPNHGRPTGAKQVLDRSAELRAQYCKNFRMTDSSFNIRRRLWINVAAKSGSKKCNVLVKMSGKSFVVDGFQCNFYLGARAKQVAAIPASQGCKPIPKVKKAKPIVPEKVTHTFKKGDRVISKWHGYGNPYPATITYVSGNKITVRYDDGASETVHVKAITRKGAAHKPATSKPATSKVTVRQPAPQPAAPSHGLRVGQRVMSKWHGTGREYPAVVRIVRGNRIQVRYTDGNIEWVPAAAVRKR